MQRMYFGYFLERIIKGNINLKKRNLNYDPSFLNYILFFCENNFKEVKREKLKVLKALNEDMEAERMNLYHLVHIQKDLWKNDSSFYGKKNYEEYSKLSDYLLSFWLKEIKVSFFV